MTMNDAKIRLVGGTLISIALAHCDSLCSNRVLKEAPSPNKHYRAVVFERGCGATTGFNTQVSLLTSSQGLRGSGNIFIVDFAKSMSKPSDVQIGWAENRKLWIRYVGHEVRIFRQEHKLGEVAVAYDVR
jgi:hypothetical protein